MFTETIQDAAFATRPRETHAMKVHLRDWRLHRNLSQTELAKRIGVTKGEISRLEGGSRRLTDKWLEKVAVAMQIRPEELFNKPSGPSAAPSVGDTPLPRPGRPTPARAPVPLMRNMMTSSDLASLGLQSPESAFGLQGAEAGTVIYRVIGDEMQPAFRIGDAAVVDTMKNRPIPPGLFLVDELGETVLRRVEVDVQSRTAHVSRDNDRYKPYDVALEELKIIGRVVARIASI